MTRVHQFKVWAAAFLLLLPLVAFEMTAPAAAAPGDFVYRVNFGGATEAVTGEMDFAGWTTFASPPTGVSTSGSTATLGTAGAGTWDFTQLATAPGTVPAGVYNNIWGVPASGSTTYSFDVPDGNYQVVILLGEHAGTIDPGERLFDVSIEGNLVMDNYDMAQTAVDLGDADGRFYALYESFDVASTGTLDIQVDSVLSVAAIRGIEILEGAATGDDTPPVITLTGPDPQYVVTGGTYNELGATWTDDVDGGPFAVTDIDDSAVNTASAGTYQVSYDAEDAATNAATTVFRTVKVVDPSQFVFRINNGGPDLDMSGEGEPNFEGVTQAQATGNTHGIANLTTSGDFQSDPNTTDTIDLSNVDPKMPEALFQTANRTNSGSGTLSFDFTVPNGDYDVLLHFSEQNSGFTTIGDRVFDLAVEGDSFTGFDMAAYQSGLNVAMTVPFEGVTVSDGTLNLSITADVSVAIVRGIEVIGEAPVPDTTPPVITLTGDNPQAIPLGGPYVELGATANDNVDGDITGDIVIDASGVNVAAVGSYEVTYDVEDEAGNPATQVIRTVNVFDPGAWLYRINNGGPDLDMSGVGEPNFEGVTQAQGSGNSHGVTGLSTSGDFQSDPNTTDTIDLSNVDANLPEALFQTANRTSSDSGTLNFDFTVANGDYDVLLHFSEQNSGFTTIGDRVFDLAVEGDSFTGFDMADYEPGLNVAMTVPFNGVTVSDGTLNVSITADVSVAIVRGIEVLTATDTTPPVITLTGDNPQTIEAGTPYVELGATWTDDVDGGPFAVTDIDTSAVDTSVPGSFEVHYHAMDAAGNEAVEVPRTVNVVDTTIPVITLLQNTPQVIVVGGTYVERGATATDNIDGDISGDIVIDATAVNTAVAGSYNVYYDVMDSSGNAAVQQVRIVTVTDAPDTTPPVITLLGANPQMVGKGGPYNEAGATATDDYDGDVTADIVIDASGVNVNAPGSYFVFYTVEDAAGNDASVSRVVQVIDYFTDDNTSIFERQINAIANEGITKGCNPPANDEFCPTALITRGQAAAFFSRLLGLTVRSDDPFTDDDGNIFEADLERAHAAGILRGCNPPDNDEVCPDRNLTRAETAAMFVRAFNLTDDGGGGFFIDTIGSVFERDIDRLRTAGVTYGCNPPLNNQFCPNNNITREQFAAFIARMLGL